MPLREYWKKGEKQALADRVGVSISYISDIIHGRKSASVGAAVKIEAAARSMGLRLDRTDVLYPNESTNPLIHVTPTEETTDER